MIELESMRVLTPFAALFLELHQVRNLQYCALRVGCPRTRRGQGARCCYRRQSNRCCLSAQAVFGHNGVKVASNWVLYLADARVRGSFAPEEDLPNSVPHSTHQMIARSIQTTAWTRVSFRQQLPGLLTSPSSSGNRAALQATAGGAG